MKLLSGHISPETAYVVEDYPYGFRLRCKIRYWIEFKAKKGFRFVSQTTNPKRPGEVWNKPKASTYSKFGGAMFLDDNGHVQWDGLSEYSDAKEAIAFRDTPLTFGAVCLSDGLSNEDVGAQLSERLIGHTGRSIERVSSHSQPRASPAPVSAAPRVETEGPR